MTTDLEISTGVTITKLRKLKNIPVPLPQLSKQEIYLIVSILEKAPTNTVTIKVITDFMNKVFGSHYDVKAFRDGFRYIRYVGKKLTIGRKVLITQEILDISDTLGKSSLLDGKC